MPDKSENVLEGYDWILSERVGRVLLLTLNRPEKLNACFSPMLAELGRVFSDADEDPQSNAIVLTGAGHAFCAGGDVQEQKKAQEYTRSSPRIRGHGQEIIERILAVEKPLISMVNGLAFGLGAILALTCDISIAADDALIAERHVNVGLVAADGGTVIYPLLVGVNRAKEFLMRGSKISGKEGAEIGLVNHAVPLEDLRTFTMEVAAELANQMPYSVRATKTAINRMLRQQLLDQMDTTTAWQGLAHHREDRLEALMAFHEKREPHFTGR